MWYKNWDASFISFVTMHALDRETAGRTDRQKGFGNTVRCITCSRTVKTVVFYRTGLTQPMKYAIKQNPTFLLMLQPNSTDKPNRL